METYGFEIYSTRTMIKCKAPKRPYIHPNTRQYVGYHPQTKPEYHVDPQFTFGGDLDAFSLRRKYENTRCKLTYVTWLKSAKIDQIMKLNNIEIALPSTFSLLTNIHMRIFFIQEWEKVFDQIK
jgi:hypothetical protein